MQYEDVTEKKRLPLPHPENELEGDVLRLRDALSLIDALLSAGDEKLLEVRDSLAGSIQLINEAKMGRNEVASVVQGGTGASTRTGARNALEVPKNTGEGASGTWPINISGSAAKVPFAGVEGLPNTLAGHGIVDAVKSSDFTFAKMGGKPATLAGYGIINAPRVGHVRDFNNDLNWAVESGIFRFDWTPTGAPQGAESSGVFVMRTDDTAAQIVVDFKTGRMFTRGAYVPAAGPAWQVPWKAKMEESPIPSDAPGGVMDCARGNYFTMTVGGNVNLSFTNVPSGAYSCVLEVRHNSGSIGMPAGAALSNGVTPQLKSGGTVHLFFFQRSMISPGSWLVSVISNY